MKKKCKTFLLSLFTFLIVFQFNSNTSFAYEVFGYTMKGGVGNWGNNTRYYWLDQTVINNSLTSTVDTAMSEWIYTSTTPGVSTPISFRKTTYKPSSVIDVYYSFYHDPSQYIAGETAFFNGSIKVWPWETAYSWTEVRLNSPTFRDLSAYNKKGTIAHEFGHAFGLAHNQVSSVIMCQLGSGRTVNRAQKDDLNGINFLY